MMLHVLLQATLMFIYLNVATNVEFTTFFSLLVAHTFCKSKMQCINIFGPAEIGW